MSKIYRCRVGFSVLFTEIERSETFGAGQVIPKERHDEIVGYRDKRGRPVVDPSWFEETTPQNEDKRAAEARRKAEDRVARLKAFHEKRASEKRASEQAKSSPAPGKPSSKEPAEDHESEAKK